MTLSFPRARLQWRWLIDSPLLLAGWASFAIGAVALAEVSRALRGADRVRLRSEQVLAQVAAESAAVQLGTLDVGKTGGRRLIGNLPVQVTAHGDEWLLRVTGPGGTVSSFSCAILPGAAPDAFGQPLTMNATRAMSGSTTGAAAIAAFPELDTAALERAWSAEMVPGLRREVGIALLHFATGTELDDFVLDQSLPGLGLPRHVDLVVVPGHLWIEAGARPCRVRLDHDVTVVVRGNFYVGRPVAIDGPGRLVVVTQLPPRSMSFVDRDGNGRWQAGEPTCDGQPFAGAVEGGGNVYLGLAADVETIDLAVGLVVAGELHLFRDACVDGPVALANGLTRIGGAALRLDPSGARLFLPERERVAGFMVRGPARAGLLRSRALNSSDDEEPLYLAAPGR